MEPTAVIVQRVHDLLRQDPPAAAAALKLVKELVVKGPCAAELSAAAGLLVLVLDKAVVPRLPRGDGELQARASHLLRAPLNDWEWSAQTTRELLDLALEAPAASEPGGETAPQLARRLRGFFGFLAEREAWIAEELPRLPDPDTQRDEFWEGAFLLLGQIVTRGDIEVSAWRHERQEMTGTLLSVAEHFEDTLTRLGRVDGGLGSMLARLREAPQNASPREFRELLEAEAKEFFAHSLALRDQVEKSREMVLRARRRLERMEEMLRAARPQDLVDPATGLPNRHALLARIHRAMTRLETLGEPCALICLELRGLEGVLEARGEAESVRLLRALARRMALPLGDDDVLARSGREGFGILVGRAGEDRALALCRALAAQLEAIRGHLGVKELRVAPVFVVMVPRPGDVAERVLERVLERARRVEARSGEAPRLVRMRREAAGTGEGSGA
ncbi:MAG: diguanylate cyclase [Magnetococcus sp. WYHC-3]